MYHIIRIAELFFNYSMINVHAPAEEKMDYDEEDFYDVLYKTYA
jgi:hypothetical protein